MSPAAARPRPAESFWAALGLAHEQAGARFHRESDRRRLRAMRRGMVAAGLLVALATGVVGLRVQQVRLSYRLDGLRATRATLEEAKSRLRVELYTLGSLARIEGKARTELGMVPPALNQVRLAREFVTGGDGLSAAEPLTASAQEPSRYERRPR
jgi:cell division protein FtsL